MVTGGIVRRTSLMVLGGLLLCARVAAAQPFVYVANADSDDVTVINAASNTVATTLTVGNEPRNPGVSPDGSRVYVPNRFDDNVTVINGVTNTVITTITDASFDEPYSAAVSPDGKRVYVANKEGGGSSTGSVTVIDAATNTVVTTIDDTCFVSPEWVIFNPAMPRAYVVNRQGDSVCVVNTTNNSVVGTAISVGSAPRSAVVTCDGAFVYVANNSGSPDISKIRTSDNSVSNINFTGGGGSPRNMSITPDNRKIYVGLQNPSLGIIATATDTASSVALSGGDSTYGTAVIPDGSRVFVTDEDDDEVEVVAVATNTQFTGVGFPIPAGNTPRGIATQFSCVKPRSVPALAPSWLTVAAALLTTFGFMRVRRRVSA
jgi:YVTN family beta-propeller protein